MFDILNKKLDQHQNKISYFDICIAKERISFEKYIDM